MSLLWVVAASYDPDSWMDAWHRNMGEMPDDPVEASKKAHEATAAVLRGHWGNHVCSNNRPHHHGDDAVHDGLPWHPRHTVFAHEIHLETGHHVVLDNPLNAMHRTGDDDYPDPDLATYKLQIRAPHGAMTYRDQHGEDHEYDSMPAQDRFPGDDTHPKMDTSVPGWGMHDTGHNDPARLNESIHDFLRHPATQAFVRRTGKGQVFRDDSQPKAG